MTARSAPDLVVIAVIGKPRGLQGECHAHAQGRTLQQLGCPVQVIAGTVDAATRSLLLTQVRSVAGGGLLCRFDGIETREQAQTLTNLQILLARDALPALEQGEYYHFELEGMRVYDGERELGVVNRVESYPTLDALEVAWHTGKTLLLPLRGDIVRHIDRDRARIEVDSRALEDIE